MDVPWKFWKSIILLCTLIHLSRCDEDIRKKIAEEKAINVYILNIPQELKKSIPPDAKFRIITGGDYVTITTNGDLRTKSKMDREEICPTNPAECVIDVEVLILTRVMPEMINVKLLLTDVNDNSPVFENSRIEKEITELTAVGSVIRLDSAVDADYGDYSVAGYSIELVEQPGASKRTKPYFKLEVIENADGTLIPQLILQRKFDREEMAVHELKLVARDGGRPPKTGIAHVRINVTDSNDNQPTFAQEKYLFNVAEDTEPDSVVAKVLATDLDKGINGKIKYTFPSVVSSSDRALFALNQDTGEITLKDFLDYENKQMHHLTIEAEDMGPNPTSAYTTVTIKVLDVNDNKPEIKVKFFSSDNVEEEEGSVAAVVPEDADIGKYLAFVTITDGDKGVNGTVSCKMSSDFFALDKVKEDEDRYLLKTMRKLDREAKATHTLTIEAKDFGTVPLRNQMTVVIKVGDVNDNEPTFDHKQFIAGVRELSKNNTVFQKLKAQDKDEGDNARITYRFKESQDFIEHNGKKVFLTDLFAIDKDSGEVRLIKEGVLDAETNLHPGQITVVASDNGSPSLNTTTILKISVIDDNDNIPQFDDESDEFVFTFPEHSSYGSFVGGVPASDNDVTKSSNAHITYSLKQSRRGGKIIRDPWFHFFKVSKDGEVHFYGDSSKLDRESDHESPITFIVVARDSGEPTLSTQKLLKIYLTDINDNAPIVTSPNVTADVAFVQIPTGSSDMYYEGATGYSDTYMLSDYRQRRDRFSSTIVIHQPVSSESEIYPTITNIVASDPDEAENSHISFAISDGNRDEYFVIDHKSGNISFANDVVFDNLKQGCHVLKVLVRDLGKETMQTTTWVSIYVTEKSEENSNATKALLECKKNPLFPRDYGKEKVKAGGFGKYTIYIIGGLAALVCIIIIAIIIVLCVRCNCCGVGSEKKYPIGGGIYGANKRKRAKQNLYEPNPRQIGESGGRTHPNGTVDSRSSFYSEWQQQEKQDHVGNLPRQSNRNSVASHHSGRDSGTGDSMPSDAYHGVHHQQQQQHPRHPEYQEEMYPQYNEYPTNQYPPPPGPEDYQTHPDSANLVVNLPPEGVFTGKCTDDCKMYGHSDACWMPDSLQRPVSRVTTFRGQEYESGSMKRVRQDPNDMRYTPQSYYYDPVNKFDNEYPPYNTGTGGRGGGGFSSFQGSPQEPKRMSQSQGPTGAFSPSNHPSFRSNQGGPRMVPNQHDEANSNLSSTSSNNPNHYNHPRNQQQYYPHFQGYHEPPAGYNQPQYYDPSGYNPHGQGFQPPYQLEPSEGEPLNFEEDYSASNLLSPQDTDARYFLPSDNPLPGPHSNYQADYNMPYHETTDESKNLVNSDQGKDSQTSDEEKLKPIREDIDAEEVVNEINTLLLDGSPNKSLDRRYYGNEV